MSDSFNAEYFVDDEYDISDETLDKMIESKLNESMETQKLIAIAASIVKRFGRDNVYVDGHGKLWVNGKPVEEITGMEHAVLNDIKYLNTMISDYKLPGVDESKLNEKSLTTDEKSKLHPETFGAKYNGEEHYPLEDAKHVRSAISFFGKCPKDKQMSLAKKIVKAAKKFGVEISEDSKVMKALNEGLQSYMDPIKFKSSLGFDVEIIYTTRDKGWDFAIDNKELPPDGEYQTTILNNGKVIGFAKSPLQIESLHKAVDEYVHHRIYKEFEIAKGFE